MRRTTRADRQRILAAIESIPFTDLSENDTARTVLSLLACDGVVDLAVYQHGPDGEWVIWLRPADATRTGRYTLADWRRDHLTLALDAYAVAEARGKAEVA